MDSEFLLHRNGRLYAVPPDCKDADVGKLKEPKGFPVEPDGAKDTR